jgi:hypothetical protein
VAAIDRGNNNRKPKIQGFSLASIGRYTTENKNILVRELFMSTKPTDKPKSVDESNTYIILFLVITAIVLCTKVSFGRHQSDPEAVTVEIISKIGSEKTGVGNFNNRIDLNLRNPINESSFDRVKNVVAGKEQIEGELFGHKYKFSVTPQPRSLTSTASDPE